MKRILPVVLGALAGAIGLPILMLFCVAAGYFLFPKFIGWMPLRFDFILTLFTMTIKSQRVLSTMAFGTCLGALSVILWRGERTLLPRFASAICSICSSIFLFFVLNHDYKTSGRLGYFWSQVAFNLPVLLWSFALFFFAILARKRKPLLP